MGDIAMFIHIFSGNDERIDEASIYSIRRAWSDIKLEGKMLDRLYDRRVFTVFEMS